MKEQNKSSVHLTVDALMEEACRVARLQDWGDTEFQEPLGQLIACFKEKYSSNEMMSLYFHAALKALLVNRLFIRDTLNNYPGIQDTQIKRPLLIVGLARTGSTLLHRLMAQDLNSRVLLYWEMHYPFIGLNFGLNHEEESIELASLRLKEMFSRAPNLDNIHETGAVLPEECMILLRHTFSSMSIVSEWLLPKYARWFIRQDMTESYLYYRKLLQILLWYKPGDFLVLKCPSHLINLNTLLNVFPDANVLWVHRHPFEALPSFFSLLSSFWGSQIKDPDFIDLILKYSSQSVEMGKTAQNKINPKQFLNVGYKQLLENPLEVIHDIYRQFSYKFSEKLERYILQWLEKNPQNKHGVHQYNLEKFGLNKTELETLFLEYLQDYEYLLA